MWTQPKTWNCVTTWSFPDFLYLKSIGHVYQQVNVENTLQSISCKEFNSISCQMYNYVYILLTILFLKQTYSFSSIPWFSCLTSGTWGTRMAWRSISTRRAIFTTITLWKSQGYKRLTKKTNLENGVSYWEFAELDIYLSTRRSIPSRQAICTWITLKNRYVKVTL